MEYDIDEFVNEYEHQYQHVNNEYKYVYVNVDQYVDFDDDDRIKLWQEHIFTSCEENDGS